MGRGAKSKRYDPNQVQVGAGQLGQFRSAIGSDTTIDDETRAELLSQATQGISVARFSELDKTLGKAREGIDPLFKGRKLFQGIRDTALSQPGRSQTVLTR
jgi:hypothetical protein